MAPKLRIIQKSEDEFEDEVFAADSSDASWLSRDLSSDSRLKDVGGGGGGGAGGGIRGEGGIGGRGGGATYLQHLRPKQLPEGQIQPPPRMPPQQHANHCLHTPASSRSQDAMRLSDVNSPIGLRSANINCSNRGGQEGRGGNGGRGEEGEPNDGDEIVEVAEPSQKLTISSPCLQKPIWNGEELPQQHETLMPPPNETFLVPNPALLLVPDPPMSLEQISNASTLHMMDFALQVSASSLATTNDTEGGAVSIHHPTNNVSDANLFDKGVNDDNGGLTTEERRSSLNNSFDSSPEQRKKKLDVMDVENDHLMDDTSMMVPGISGNNYHHLFHHPFHDNVIVASCTTGNVQEFMEEVEEKMDDDDGHHSPMMPPGIQRHAV